jgi:hypothetical protein
MNTAWKRLFLWSSIGSIFVGAGLTAARRSKPPKQSIRCQKIPPDCRRVLVWTEPVQIEVEGITRLERDCYTFQRTPFLVWSVLAVPTRPGRDPEGARVYHVTRSHQIEGDEHQQRDLGPVEQSRERYYGTIHCMNPEGRICGKNSLARGALLEIRKCRVGGASNGVETGEIHRSVAPVLNYRFEYTPDDPNTINPPVTA